MSTKKRGNAPHASRRKVFQDPDDTYEDVQKRVALLQKLPYSYFERSHGVSGPEELQRETIFRMLFYLLGILSEENDLWTLEIRHDSEIKFEKAQEEINRRSKIKKAMEAA